MAKEKNTNTEEKKRWKRMNNGGTPGAVYGLGFLGALVYFLQHASTFGDGVLGVLKAIVWPALVIFKLLEFFRM